MRLYPFCTHIYASNPDVGLETALAQTPAAIKAQIPERGPTKILSCLYVGSKSRLRALRTLELNKSFPSVRIDTIPSEILGLVGQYLPSKDLAQAIQVNKQFSQGFAHQRALYLEGKAIEQRATATAIKPRNARLEHLKSVLLQADRIAFGEKAFIYRSETREEILNNLIEQISFFPAEHRELARALISASAQTLPPSKSASINTKLVQTFKDDSHKLEQVDHFHEALAETNPPRSTVDKATHLFASVDRVYYLPNAHKKDGFFAILNEVQTMPDEDKAEVLRHLSYSLADFFSAPITDGFDAILNLTTSIDSSEHRARVLDVVIRYLPDLPDNVRRERFDSILDSVDVCSPRELLTVRSLARALRKLSITEIPCRYEVILAKTDHFMSRDDLGQSEEGFRWADIWYPSEQFDPKDYPTTIYLELAKCIFKMAPGEKLRSINTIVKRLENITPEKSTMNVLCELIGALRTVVDNNAAKANAFNNMLALQKKLPVDYKTSSLRGLASIISDFHQSECLTHFISVFDEVSNLPSSQDGEEVLYVLASSLLSLREDDRAKQFNAILRLIQTQPSGHDEMTLCALIDFIPNLPEENRTAIFDSILEQAQINIAPHKFYSEYDPLVLVLARLTYSVSFLRPADRKIRLEALTNQLRERCNFGDEKVVMEEFFGLYPGSEGIDDNGLAVFNGVVGVKPG